MRQTTRFASNKDLLKLDLLSNQDTPPAEYRAALRDLGVSLGTQVAAELKDSVVNNICLACTVEDADSLAQGIIDALEQHKLAEKIRLTCFWNTRIELPGASLAPIIKEYSEPCDVGHSIVVVAKSIIASGCVVRTNLSRLIERATPKKIYIVSPVMLKGADKALKSEFRSEIARRFSYITFALDSERDAKGMVLPGVGGDIYIRLGHGGMSKKNDIMPDLVKSRREKAFIAQGITKGRTHSTYTILQSRTNALKSTFSKPSKKTAHCFHKCA